GPYPREQEGGRAGHRCNRPKRTKSTLCPTRLKQERDPVVFGIPDQDREKDRQRDQSRGVGMRPRQPATAARLGQQKASCADNGQHRGIFGTQSETGAYAGSQPPAPRCPTLRWQRSNEANGGPEQG